MKKLFVLFLFLTFFGLSGCVVKEKEVKNSSCFNNLNNKIKIVVVENIFKEIKTTAQEFEKKDKNVKFELVKLKDNLQFRKNTLKQILNNKANVFFVHGEKDVLFFKDLIENFSLKKNKENVEVLKDSTALKLKENYFGIWVNLKFLKELEKFEDFEKSLNSLKTFLNFANGLKNKTSLKNLIVREENLTQFIFNLGFKDLEISNEFEQIFKILADEKKEINFKLLNKETAFYIGSNNFLNQNSFKEKNGCNLKCYPLPILNNKKILKEKVFLCLTKNNTATQKQKILEFFEYAVEKQKSKNFKLCLKENNFLNSTLEFKIKTKDLEKRLQKGEISFKSLKEKLKKEYELYKTLNLLF